MQYETIILELLSRIKKLEDEVNELKSKIFTNTDILETNSAISETNNIGYVKMTDEMIDYMAKVIIEAIQ